MRAQPHMFVALHAQQHAIPRVKARVVAMQAEADAVRFTETGTLVK